MKKNCWEFKNCGRQLGGQNVGLLGVCPASIDKTNHGKNSGINGGRYCWQIAGTFCGEKVQGEYAKKISTCMVCDFFKLVREEEGIHMTV
ncbi:hypothetical protein KKB99_06760 [bacterium]|nr:hypothetical protein [bacterium]MBU1025691.1 hypothetical protein [bacterium]